MQSDAVHRAADSWIRAELPGSGGQALFVTVGMHGEAAVAAAPVTAVRGKAVRENMAVRTKPVKKLQVFCVLVKPSGQLCSIAIRPIVLQRL